MCDGSKNKPPLSDCFDTETALDHMRNNCHGKYLCDYTIPANLVDITEECAPLKKNLDVNYLCGNFFMNQESTDLTNPN